MKKLAKQRLEYDRLLSAVAEVTGCCQSEVQAKLSVFARSEPPLDGWRAEGIKELRRLRREATAGGSKWAIAEQRAKQERDAAKAVCYAILYGAGPGKLMNDLAMGLRTGKKVLGDAWNAFDELEQKHKD